MGGWDVSSSVKTQNRNVKGGKFKGRGTNDVLLKH